MASFIHPIPVRSQHSASPALPSKKVTLLACNTSKTTASPPSVLSSQTPATLNDPTTVPLPKTPLPSIPSDAVPYFAYFSNLNPRSFGPTCVSPTRRFQVFQTSVATLSGYKLSLSSLGIPLEPAFATIVPNSSSQVRGVVHFISRDDFSRLSLSEFSLPSSSPLLPLVRSIAPRVEQVLVQIDGTEIHASTFIFPTNAPSWAKPSRRYVSLAIDGAKYWGLDESYIESELASIKCDLGPLGGFGLYVEPRIHPLDRPNPNRASKKSMTELYSPYAKIRAETAVKNFKESDDIQDHKSLRLIPTMKPDTSGSKRLLYFIPGIDGNGKSVLNQVHDLEQEGIYDLKAIAYPCDNRESAESLVSSIMNMIREDCQGRPVSIVAESMGGALSLMLAVENSRLLSSKEPIALDIDLLLLINPASSYHRSQLRPVWDFLLNASLSDAVYKALLPPLLLPLVIDLTSATSSFSFELVPHLRDMLFSLRRVGEVLPIEAMKHRLSLLRKIHLAKDELGVLAGPKGPAAMACISVMNDNLIPSYSEGFRLQRAIPTMYNMAIPFGGHAPMLDTRFSLASFLRPFASGALPPVSPSLPPPIPPSPAVAKRREALRRRFKARSEPFESGKSRAEMQRMKNYFAPTMEESAPVFVGEENIPEFDPERPVLFVSNHTLLGWLDGALPVIRLVEKRGILVRCLVHPLLMRTGMLAFPGTGMESASVEEVKKYGIQQVGPQALLENLALGRWSFLFPGGAKEALKQPGDEKYQVLWPKDVEFVRACALFGAIIVPVSTIGSEDRVRILAGSEVTERVVGPIFGTIARLNGQKLEVPSVNAREWKGGQKAENVVPPLMVPGDKERLYYRFGKAILVEEGCLEDGVKEREVYEEVQRRIREGVEILKRRREKDMFRDEKERKAFGERYGDLVEPPASPGWSWARNKDEYLDEEYQPSL